MAGTFLVLRDDQQEFDAKQVAALKQLGVSNATPADLGVFFHQCRKTGLDPFSRQIYMIGRYDGRSQSTKWTIQAAIDGLRIVALRTGEYAGQVGPLFCGPDGAWTDVWLGEGPPAAAKIGVLRKGFDEPLWAVARYSSYAQTTANGSPTSTWAKMPDVMLAKCAEALALRKAFPQDLSGIYAAEEMGQAFSPPQQPNLEAASRLRTAAQIRQSPPEEQVVEAEVVEDEQSAEKPPEDVEVLDPEEHLWPSEEEQSGPAAARSALKKSR